MIHYYVVPGIKEIRIATPESEKGRAEEIIKIVARYCGSEVREVKSKSRLAELVQARHLSFHFIRTMTTLSLKSIGQLFKRDHTTVIHGLDHLSDMVETNDRYYVTAIEAIKPKLFGI